MPEVTLSQRPVTSNPVQATPSSRQMAPVEAPAAPTATPETKAAIPGADRLAAIARKEAALHQQRVALKAERDRLESERNLPVADRQELERLRLQTKQFLDDPYGAYLAAGLTADQIAAKMLSQPNPADQRTQLLEAQIAELKAQVAQASGKVDEAAQVQRESAIKQIDADIKMLIDSEPEFETIKARGATSDVTSLIIEVYDKGWPEMNMPAGTMLDNVQAAKYVEEFLLEEAIKMASLGKVKAKLSPRQTEAQVPAKQPGMQTLSNRMTPSTTKTLTWAERRARAIAVAEGKNP